MGDAIPLSRFKGVIGGESELPLCFATFAFKSRPARQGIMQKNLLYAEMLSLRFLA